MKVTFQNPLQGNPFHLVNNNPFLNAQSTNGVYVYGLLVNVDGFDKFVPVYVGIGNLENRLVNNHYRGYKNNGNGKKELWNFINNNYTNSEITRIYKEMNIYEMLNSIVKTPYNSSRSYMEFLNQLHNLIYFQNNDFFHVKHNLNQQQLDLGQIDMLNYLTNNNLNQSAQVLANVKLNFTNNFYFVYADLYSDVTEVSDEINLEYNGWNNVNQYIVNNINGPGRNLLERIELATKNKLKKIDIYTSAKASGQNLTMNIDLSNIQQNLINLTGEPFTNPLIL
jgi:hypothetical protein